MAYEVIELDLMGYHSEILERQGGHENEVLLNYNIKDAANQVVANVQLADWGGENSIVQKQFVDDDSLTRIKMLLEEINPNNCYSGYDVEMLLDCLGSELVDLEMLRDFIENESCGVVAQYEFTKEGERVPITVANTFLIETDVIDPDDVIVGPMADDFKKNLDLNIGKLSMASASEAKLFRVEWDKKE